MFDKDLAKLYGVLTKNLNKAVIRNIERFPEDFMFRLTKQEYDSSRFQIGTLKRGHNIKIMRVFVKLKELMISHKDLARKIEDLQRKFKDHDKKFVLVFEAIKQLLEEKEEPPKSKGPMGFVPIINGNTKNSRGKF